MAIFASNHSRMNQASATLGDETSPDRLLEEHDGCHPVRQIAVDISCDDSCAEAIYNNLRGWHDSSKSLDESIDRQLALLVAPRVSVSLLVIIVFQKAFIRRKRGFSQRMGEYINSGRSLGKGSLARPP